MLEGRRDARVEAAVTQANGWAHAEAAGPKLTAERGAERALLRKPAVLHEHVGDRVDAIGTPGRRLEQCPAAARQQRHGLHQQIGCLARWQLPERSAAHYERGRMIDGGEAE